MTHKWQERRGSLRYGHSAEGPHGIVTEVQNLDEALDEVRRRNIQTKRVATNKAKGGKRTLRQLFADARLSAMGRYWRGEMLKNRVLKAPDPFAWETIEQRDAMICRLYATSYWNARDLGRKFRLTDKQVLAITNKGNVKC